MFTLSIKQSDLDGVHNVRVAFGNGLRVDIWEEFKNRFKIPRIVEFFGATEGTGVFTNVTNTVGAIGRMSPLMVRQWTIKMVSVSQLVELWIMLDKWFNTNFNICVINIDILVHIIVNVFHYEFVYVPYGFFFCLLQRATIYRDVNFQIHFLKFDNSAEKPVRDKNGLCIPIKPGLLVL